MKYTEKKVSVPLSAVSTTPGLVNKTGTWKFAEPHFVDRTSPCNQQCPAGEDIAGYMYLVGQERFEEAWRLIMQENPFPAIMGRVCFHTCEDRCNRRDYDEALVIHVVERFIGDYGLSKGLTIAPPEEEKGKNVAVVGAGPAGLSTAYQLRIMGYAVTVFDSNEKPGGMMRYGIPSYRLPKDILDSEIDRLSAMGIEFVMGKTLGSDISWDALAQDYDAVFVAIGAWEEAKPGIGGLDKQGVWNALEFLRDVNVGKRPDIGSRVVVIGGGNSAIDCARSLRRLGAEVTIAYRRTEVEMPAHPEEVELAKEEGVQFLFLTAPKEVTGQEHIDGLTMEKMALGEEDSSGRRRPVPTGEFFEVQCDGMVTAVGEGTRADALPPALAHQGGVVEADGMGGTATAKFFAGGDIIDIPHTVTHAVGSGKRAAVAIDRFLKGEPHDEGSLDRFRWGEQGNVSIGRMQGTMPFPRRNQDSEVVGLKDMNTFYFDHRPRLRTHRIPVQERLQDFQEVIASPPQDEVVAEAQRCFICGSCTECGNCYIFCPECAIKADPGGYGYIADMEYCKGCGICINECPRGALKMEVME
jgi:NADPH-dependent glutamate synthase beta subunit-like oxidoreductase/Pyruvate/2-oxoacid:ferredoxin oxidoreductase delta subunit